MRGIVEVADHSPSHDRLAADRGLHGLRHRPCDLWHVFGHAAVDLALEVLGDLRTPQPPPGLGGRDLAAVPQGQGVRPVRIRVGFGGGVVRRARLAGGRTAIGARPQLRDAQLPHHVGVVFARELIQARALLGAEQEGVPGRGRSRRRRRWRRCLGQERRREQHAQGEREDTS